MDGLAQRMGSLEAKVEELVAARSRRRTRSRSSTADDDSKAGGAAAAAAAASAEEQLEELRSDLLEEMNTLVEGLRSEIAASTAATPTPRLSEASSNVSVLAVMVWLAMRDEWANSYFFYSCKSSSPGRAHRNKPGDTFDLRSWSRRVPSRRLGPAFRSTRTGRGRRSRSA